MLCWQTSEKKGFQHNILSGKATQLHEKLLLFCNLPTQFCQHQSTLFNMQIPLILVPFAYMLSKKVYEGKITFIQARDQLVGEDRMNKNSAADYINNFRYMKEGKRFTRTLNAFSMEYYFENIYNDYGSPGLSQALIALKRHIDYYEDIQKVRMHNMRTIYEKYAAIPIDSPDEQEEKEIISLLKIAENRNKIIEDLRILSSLDPVEVAIGGKTFKRDNKTIAQLKILRNFRCQICQTTIQKKDGTLYIEVAHIDPKRSQGCETPENILLLCPNHHKEFDLGNLQILSRTAEELSFELNGVARRLCLKIE